jgi:hypothetical protein
MVSLNVPNLQHCRGNDKEQNKNPAPLQKVFTLDRIWCSRCSGFGVHVGPDSAFTMNRKMHTYVGNDGKRKSIQKSHHSKPEAKKLLKEMLAKLDGITSVTYCRSYGFALWRGSL